MSRVYHTSDWHIGHDGVCRFRPIFKSDEEHDECILDNFNDTITSKDTVYIHGDAIFDKRHIDIVKKLPGHKHLILGNHCLENKKNRPTLLDLYQVFESITSVVNKRGTWMTHIPIHPDELRGKYCIHGHTHYHVIDDDRYFNVCLEHTDWKPILREQLLEGRFD